MADRLLNKEQVSIKLSLSIRKVDGMHSSGQMIAGIHFGKSLRFSEKELDAWIGEGCPSREIWEAAKEKQKQFAETHISGTGSK